MTSDNSPTMLTIDTASGIQKKPEFKVVEPLDLYDEKLPLLKQVIPEYTLSIPNDELTYFIKQLRMTRKKFGGVGLAANQCGYPMRAFVIGTDEFDIVCINPKITKASEKLVKKQEGCLSFPAFFMNVARPETVDVEYINENGDKVVDTLYGVTAQCFQHELDHLNGIRIIDHGGATSIMMARKKQVKILKRVTRQGKS